MNQSSRFGKPSDFWRALQSWVRWAIVLGGLILGVSIWFSVWASAAPLVVLFFMAATGTTATIVKILIAGIFVLSFPVAVLVVPWLGFQLTYWTSNLIITANESESFEDFIFKK